MVELTPAGGRTAPCSRPGRRQVRAPAFGARSTCYYSETGGEPQSSASTRNVGALYGSASSKAVGGALTSGVTARMLLMRDEGAANGAADGIAGAPRTCGAYLYDALFAPIHASMHKKGSPAWWRSQTTTKLDQVREGCPRAVLRSSTVRRRRVRSRATCSCSGRLPYGSALALFGAGPPLSRVLHNLVARIRRRPPRPSGYYRAVARVGGRRPTSRPSRAIATAPLFGPGPGYAHALSDAPSPPCRLWSPRGGRLGAQLAEFKLELNFW